MIIKPAAQICAETPVNADFYKACDNMMGKIEKAAAEGKLATLFDPYPRGFHEDVKKAFLEAGYTFRPVGMIGGVMQDAEEICWGQKSRNLIPWIVFKSRDRELVAISMTGLSAVNLTEFKESIAQENGISVDEITILAVYR